ncbi:SusD/RagB family nutrient-binding outer membrane lipoprotein [Parabacteroides sp. Marseille-P3160]|uniref:SusD/RagB family nutrient-binding outer membrane lipoprotein n=1 Tax=Parabacteroides sp. Marseille-P3160 TaxID=1917887 RepID=UPI0009BC4053|nr:SusD/RagB family nutrient-binding outer membrane lipoprotein [Parabacteroides sp. Marseille-P3160]
MKRYIKNMGLACIMAIMIVSCTGDFESMNTNPLAATEVTPSLLLTKMEEYGFNCRSWEYQVGNNLYTNDYVQYISNTATYFSTSNYEWNDSWANDGFWKSYYTYLAKPLHETKVMLEKYPEYSNIYQMMRIISAMGAARTTDMFGDVPYFNAATGEITPKYDSQKDIYYDIFKELTEASELLSSNTGQTDPGSNDIIYGGDVSRWIKLANACRLRYAMRLRYIDPDKSKTEAEAALKASLMESNADNAGIAQAFTNNGHSLYIIAFWNEFRASKTMIDMMLKESSVVDPRISMWFSKTQAWQYGNEYQDINKSIPVVEWQGVPNGRNTFVNQYAVENNSCIWGLRGFPGWNLAEKGSVASGSTASDFNGGSSVVVLPMIIFNYAEVCFLKAEAALFGYSGAGVARTNYENGILASFAETRSVVDASYYTTQNDNAYINSGYVAWGTDTEDNFRKIMTQKWIGFYPNSIEAWAEFRRTGYPLYDGTHQGLRTIEINNSSTVPQGQFVKRLRYLDDEINLNPNASDPSLNNSQNSDPKSMNVRVWWDTNRYQ